MAQVFISYAREDVVDARALSLHLRRGGHEPWLDVEQLLPGQRWEPAIQAAIRSSHFFVALLSTRSVQKRGFVQRELREALAVLDEVPDDQIFLIPIRLEECSPTHSRLMELHWLDFFPKRAEGLARLDAVLNFAPKATLIPSLLGSAWDVFDSGPGDEYEAWWMRFDSDGVLQYESHGEILQNATWKQAGADVYLEFNRKYSQLRGVLNGNVIEGEGQNIKGVSWRWRATRVAA